MSVELPVALRPWASSLAMFPDDLALAIGDIVRRLSLALGEFRVDAARGSGEPDGFDGLTRKGELERLLTSEWLLASELPDEFLRRVASAEVSFLKLAQREPAKPRWSVALLDAGPTQLGTPRIGQLAALVTLAARAERARAKFRWAVLQHPVATWAEGLSESSIKSLLSARTLRGGAELTRAWLDDPGAQSGDCWVLAGNELLGLSLPSHVSRLAFSERGSVDETILAVTCKPAGKQARLVELPLPSQQVSVRLIRDPFEGKRIENRTPVAPTQIKNTGKQIIAGGNLLFIESGRRLAYISSSGSVIVVPIPNSPNASKGNDTVMQLDSGYAPLACGWKVGRCFIIGSSKDSASGEHLPAVFSFGKRGGLISAAWKSEIEEGTSSMRWAPPPDPSTLLGRIVVSPRTGQSWETLCAQDGGGRIVTFRARAGRPPSYAVEGRAMAIRATADGYAYITRTEPWSGPDSPLVVIASSGASRVECGLERDRIVSAFFGPAWGELGPIAARYDGDEWRIVSGKSKPSSVWLPGKTVIGVTLMNPDNRSGPFGNDAEPALVVVDGVKLEAVNAKQKRLLFAAPENIRAGSVCDATGAIAFVLNNDDIYVYSQSWSQVVLHLRAPASTSGGSA
ncbi:MAG: hypothetical protein U0165_02210 [Polyangiaceae bacterium]